MKLKTWLCGKCGLPMGCMVSETKKYGYVHPICPPTREVLLARGWTIEEIDNLKWAP